MRRRSRARAPGCRGIKLLADRADLRELSVAAAPHGRAARCGAEHPAASDARSARSTRALSPPRSNGSTSALPPASSAIDSLGALAAALPASGGDGVVDGTVLCLLASARASAALRDAQTVAASGSGDDDKAVAAALQAVIVESGAAAAAAAYVARLARALRLEEAAQRGCGARVAQLTAAADARRARVAVALEAAVARDGIAGCTAAWPRAANVVRALGRAVA